MIELMLNLVRLLAMPISAPSAMLAALALVAVLAAALAVVIRSGGIPVPRMSAVGRRTSRDAVLLSVLPASSHPDAAGHVRSRAPGRFSAVV